MTGRTIIIYHKNCLDGYGAALAAILNAEEAGVEDFDLYPLDYSDRESFLSEVDIKDNYLHILDFSFNKIQTAYIRDSVASLVWLDHHKSAFEEHEIPFEPYVENLDNGIYICLSPNLSSGAWLAWDYYMGEVPNLIQHIDDRDRWKFKLRGTKQICLALSKLKQDPDVWCEHLDEVGALFTRGSIIQEYYDEQLSRAIESTKESCTIAGVSGLCCNLPPMFASEAGNKLAAESGTFGATWFKTADGDIKWSLRSIGDFDVTEICKKFGGGGHKNAAGFHLNAGSEHTISGIRLEP